MLKPHITIAYNQPQADFYQALNEAPAEIGVLEEVEAVEQALNTKGYPFRRLAVSPPLKRAREVLAASTGLIFNLFEGFGGDPGSEAEFARIIETSGRCFTGNSSAVLELALDKARAKIALRQAGIDTPEFQLLGPNDVDMFHLSFPCIVKPRAEDASHSLSEQSVVFDLPALKRELNLLWGRYKEAALVEEFVHGREFNVTVVGNDEPVALPPSEIIYTLPEGLPQILTFSAKWQPDSLYFKSTKAVCPANVDKSLRDKIKQTAVASFRALGCHGYARADMRLDGTSHLQVMEVNPNPDISPSAGAALQARIGGYEYVDFIENIVNLAVQNSGF